MPTWNVPSDSHAVGDTGHTTDHNHVADDLTLVATAFPGVTTGAAQTAHNTLDDGSGNMTIAGNAEFIGAGPVISYVNTTATQFFGAGMLFYNNIASLGNQGGVGLFEGIHDAGITHTYLDIQQINYQGNYVQDLILLDLNTQIVTFYMIAQFNAGTDTSGTATASNPSFTSGTAKQLSTSQDAMLYLTVNTAGTYTIALGPTSTPANTLVNNVALPIGAMHSIRVPQGWYVKITGTIANLTLVQVTC